MKGWLTIWAFYLLSLSLIPCSDGYNDCPDPGLPAQSIPGHDHRNDADDHCTPLCHCSCCGAHVVQWNLPVTGLLRPWVIFPLRQLHITSLPFVSGYYGEIWQPPRIVA